MKVALDSQGSEVFRERDSETCEMVKCVRCCNGNVCEVM